MLRSRRIRIFEIAFVMALVAFVLLLVLSIYSATNVFGAMAAPSGVTWNQNTHVLTWTQHSDADLVCLEFTPPGGIGAPITICRGGHTGSNAVTVMGASVGWTVLIVESCVSICDDWGWITAYGPYDLLYRHYLPVILRGAQ